MAEAQEDNLISINVWLAGRSYRIRISPDEEEGVRKAVKLADEQIAEMRSNYAGKDDQDFIAMCLLMYATDSVTQGTTNTHTLQVLKGMIRMIDEKLATEEQ